MSDLKAGVTDRLEALIGQYETPRFFIDKRNDKLLDFDSCKNRVDKYKMDPERLKEVIGVVCCPAAKSISYNIACMSITLLHILQSVFEILKLGIYRF